MFPSFGISRETVWVRTSGGHRFTSSDEAAVFEATHGTATKYAGQDVINPGSLILSGAMMFDHLGWSEAAQRMTKAMETTIASKVVTYDLARQMEGAKKVKCSEFANAIIENL